MRYLVLLSLIVFGCSPQVADKKFVTKRPDLNVDSADAGLQKAHQGFNAEGFQSVLKWDGEYDSDEVFSTVANLHKIATQFDVPEANKMSEQLFSSFYSDDEAFTGTPIIDSNYFRAAIGVADEDVLEQVREQAKFIFQQETLIEEVVSNIDMNEVTSKTETLEMYDAGINVLNKFLEELQNDRTIHPLAKEAVVDEGRKLIDSILVPAKTTLAEIYNPELPLEKTIESTRRLLDQFAPIADVEISEENQDLMDRVVKFSPHIERIQSRRDRQKVLDALIELYFFFDRESDRRELFEANDLKELYEFFISDDRDWECLRKDDTAYLSLCGITHTIKKTKIFPEIRRTGVIASRDKLKNGFRKQIVQDNIEPQLRTALASLQQLVGDQVAAGFAVQSARLAEAEVDLTNFASGYVNEFERRNFSEENQRKGTFLYEVRDVKVQGHLKEGPQVSSSRPSYDSVYSPKVHGTQLQALHHRWESQQSTLVSGTGLKDHRGEVLGALNKMLALGGFQTQGDRLVGGLLQPVVEEQPSLNLLQIGSNDALYGVPSQIRFRDDSPVSNTINVGDQAALISGLSKMMMTFADWKKNDSVSLSIGNFRASSLIPDLTGKAANQKIFPKDQLFSMIIAQTAALLKGIQTPEHTPIAMIYNDGTPFFWYGNNEDSDRIAAIAGLVDFKDGVRSRNIYAKDVADFIVAVGDFYKATAEIKKSRADILNEKNIPSTKVENGVEVTEQISALELIDRNRKELKTLVLGLTSFLVLSLKEDGSIASSYELDKQTLSTSDKNLSTYLRAIKAFSTAKELYNDDEKKFDETLFVKPVVKILKYMNSPAMWDSKTSFYKHNEAAATPAQVIEGISVLKQVSPQLPESTATQLNTLLDKWVGQLRNQQ